MPVHNVPHISPQAIYLCSTDGIQLNTYGNHCQFPLRNPIVIPSNCQGYVSLSSFRFSNVFYTVNPFNQMLYYSLSNEISTVLEYTIPLGNYNITSLVTQLNIDLADHSMVFEYDPKTYKITVSNAVFGFIFRDGPKSFHMHLGLVVPTPQSVSYTADRCIDIGGVPVITISVPSLHIDSNGTRIGESSILDRVTNSVLSGQTMSYSDSAQNRYRIYESTVSTIEIRLSNQGIDLDFLGTAWYITLHINFIYTPLYIAPYNDFPVGGRIPTGAVSDVPELEEKAEKAESKSIK